MNQPLVSIVMSVYNGASFLNDSIESILNQTYGNFEFIIINDCSTDNSREIIKNYDDSRIILIDNEENLKLPSSLNKALKIAKGKYIARMDDDDIAMPYRIEKQVSYLEQNENVGLLGTYAELFGDKKGVRKHSEDSDELKVRTFFSCQFCHPTVMIRKAVLDKFSLSYNPSFSTAQDFEFWSRMIDKTDFGTIPEVLLKYGFHSKQVSQSKREEQIINTKKIYSYFLNLLEIDKSYLLIHLKISDFNFERSIEEVKEIGEYFNLLIERNQNKKVFEDAFFSKFLAEYYYNILKSSDISKLQKIKLFDKYKFNRYFRPQFHYIKLFFS